VIIVLSSVTIWAVWFFNTVFHYPVVCDLPNKRLDTRHGIDPEPSNTLDTVAPIVPNHPCLVGGWINGLHNPGLIGPMELRRNDNLAGFDQLFIRINDAKPIDLKLSPFGFGNKLAIVILVCDDPSPNGNNHTFFDHVGITFLSDMRSQNHTPIYRALSRALGPLCTMSEKLW
jgi:hypothetical protein